MKAIVRVPIVLAADKRRPGISGISLLGALAVFAALPTSAAVYTYTEASSTTTEWAAGTSWSAVPVSAADTTLNFTNALLAGVNVVSDNDIAGNFLLNRVNFTYTGPASGTTPTVTISGSPLEFTGANATFSFGPPGNGNLSLPINNNLVLSTNLTFSTGTASTAPARIVSLNGVISGAGSLTFSWGAAAPAVFKLSNQSNSYAGSTRLMHSSTSSRTFTLRLGASNVIPNGAGKGNVYFSNGSEANGAGLELYGCDETINGLESNLPSSNNDADAMRVRNQLASSTSTLTVGDNDANATFCGSIRNGAGVLNVTKIGSGTQVLASGGTDYTGTTTISQGTLKVDYSQRSNTKTTNPTNYFSSVSDVILAGGTTFAVEGRRDGAAVTEAIMGATAGNRGFTITNTIADVLTVGQGMTLTNALGGSATTWITGLSRGASTTIIGASVRVAGYTKFSTVNETATTSQTLKSLTLSGASGSNVTIDLGTNDRVVLTFNTAPIQINDGSMLTITNWSGVAEVGGGAERLMFVGTPTAFSNVFSQSEVNFVGYEPGYKLISGSGVYEVVAKLAPKGTVLLLK